MILADGPMPDAEESRRRILEELAKPAYDHSEGFVQWLLGRIDAWLTALVDGIDGSSPLQGILLVIAVLAVLVVLVAVLRRTGWLRRSASVAVSADLAAEQQLTGQELRRAASASLDASRHDEAAVLALRAVVRDLEERTLLEVTDGMTAREAAVGAAASFPDLRRQLEQGALAFDTAAYSHRSIRPKQAADLLRLAEYIAQARPELGGQPSRPAHSPVGDDADPSLSGARP